MNLGFESYASSAPSGTISGAGVATVMAKGALNDVFNTNPEISYFMNTIERHTMFAYEITNQSLEGQQAYGTEGSTKAQKSADQLGPVYAVIERPGIKAIKTDERGYSGHRRGSTVPKGSRRNRRSKYKYKHSAHKERASGRGASGRSHFSQSKFPVSSSSKKHVKHGRKKKKEKRKKNRNRRSRRYEESSSSSEDDFSESDFSEDEDALYDSDDSVDSGEEDTDNENKSDEEEPWAHYVNDFGFAAIERATCSLANQVAQTLTGRFMQAFYELCALPGNEPDELVGHFDTREELIAASSVPQRIYVPIPFSFGRFLGRTFSLISSRFHPTGFSIALAPLQKLIKVSGPDVTVVKTHDNVIIQPTDVRVSMDMTYYFMDEDERSEFLDASCQQVWEQTQYLECSTKTGEINVPLSFNHTCRGVIMCAQRTEAAELNDTFNYDSHNPNVETIAQATMTVNGTPLFSRPGDWLRKLQRFQNFPRKPRNKLYPYCFGSSVHEEQSTGSYNFTRMETGSIKIKLAKELHDTPVTVYVWAMIMNGLEYDGGMIRVLYQ